ncbi:MAG: ABC transporter permease [Bacteroidales bacterium]
MILKMIAIEFKKIRSTPALWISILGPFFISLLLFLIFYSGNNYGGYGANPYDALLSRSWNFPSIVLIPMFVVIINSLIINIEHSSGGWKMLLTAPVSRFLVYVSKWISISLVILLTFLMMALFILGFVMLLSLLKPDAGFSGHNPDLQIFFWRTLKMFIATLAMSTLQYQLSLWMKNSFKSIGIGLIGVIAGMILMEWKYIDYFPYAYTGRSFTEFDPGNTGILLHEYLSLGYMAVFLIAGWFLWKGKQFK